MNTYYTPSLLSIQTGLEQLWPLIDFYSSHPGLSNYSAPVLEAAKTVEQMITLLAYEHGFSINERNVVRTNTGEVVADMFTSPFAFVMKGFMEDIPKEIRQFIRTIQIQRNIAAHPSQSQGTNDGISYGQAVMFAEAFDCFVGWFVLNSSTLKEHNGSSLSAFLSRVDSLSKRLTLQISSRDSEPKEHKITTTIQQAKLTIESGSDTAEINSEILGKMTLALGMLDQISNGIVHIEKKVNEIADKLDIITKQINEYQSLLAKQIDMATSEEEIDRIISAYTEVCAARIVRDVNSSFASQSYEAEREKLVQSMGESAWNKLDVSSQNFLITAKVTYNNLITMHDVIDYSGVCLLVTKAVEVEMSNRFCRDYLAYLKEKYPGKANYRMFPTSLLNKYGKPIRIKDFTLGTVAYVLCYSIADGITVEQEAANQARLVEYVSSRLMKGKDQAAILASCEMIAEGVENIRLDYRNPSAHTNQLQQINAQQCFDLVLDVEKLLKTILDLLEY